MAAASFVTYMGSNIFFTDKIHLAFFLNTDLFHTSYGSYLTGGAKKRVVQIESSTDICTLLCVKQTAREAAIQHSGLSSALGDDRREWEGGSRGREYMHTYRRFMLLYSRN